MMETTPRSVRSCNSRYRRVPTPKMSERKKKLFDDVLSNGDSPTQRNPYVRLERIIVEEADDSDIGPMSPLEFSSSPTSFNEVHRMMSRHHKDASDEPTHRTNFAHILNGISKDELSQSERPNKSTIVHPHDSNSSSGTDANAERTRDSSEEDVVGPLCTSMKKLSSMTEQNYEQQMKTPNEMSTSSKTASEPGIGRGGASFRKSLTFDSALTPHVDDSNSMSVSKFSGDHELSGERGPKAKTSLTFVNEPTISVRSFYGKSIEKPTQSAVAAVAKVQEIGAALAKQKSKLKSKPKFSGKSKTLAKRMKAPSLWRFSGKMKFHRFKRQRSMKAKKNSSISESSTKAPTENDVENIPPTINSNPFSSTIEQNLRLQKILKENSNAATASREINWIGGTSKALDTQTNRIGFSDGEDDDDSEQENQREGHTYQEIEVEVETNRKFFKSSGSNSAKKYRIMGRLSATKKRGGDLKIDLPKRKKKKPNKGEEFVVLHHEITSIIDRLSSPGKNKPKDISSDSEHDTEPSNQMTKATVECNQNEASASVAAVIFHPIGADFIEEQAIDPQATAIYQTDVEKYRQMIPYNTSDPEKMSQQESILELLISNGICDDQTFKIFITEPDLHKDKASQILDSLYCVNTMMPNEYDNEIEWVNSVESMPLVVHPNDSTEITGPNSIEPSSAPQSPQTAPALNIITTAQVHSVATESDEGQNGVASEKLFPIFSKNFQAKDGNGPTFTALSKTSRDWQPIGDQQYQIDAGQKEFGLRTCPQCEMQYSVHEPEDELLHQKYHNCVNVLTFKGWNNERIVTQIPEWGPNGRIIYVCEADSKAKKERVKEVLNMVDRDLGFATLTELKPKTLVYFAIAKQQIVGVCVVQPLERAHRLKTINGIDCSTTETFPVKCGISRIWVAPQYRRHGIAAKLITSMRGHFLFGAFLTFDEIAFSSPTENGKQFAASLAQRSDFLIYES